ncbi:MAG: hypothetical protein U5L96_00515 [Owenweeksia sp.]|nr:hypothetical protein [Owenweeksia sp.]
MEGNEKALLIADTPYFGKIIHFRKAGIAVPQAAARQNLLRLRT